MNRRKKSWISEHKCEEALQKEGWITERMQYSGNQYQARKDFFGLWDVIALKDKEIKFIQVKTNHKPVMKPFEEFAAQYKCEHKSFEVWIWYEEGAAANWQGWRKIILK